MYTIFKQNNKSLEVVGYAAGPEAAALQVHELRKTAIKDGGDVFGYTLQDPSTWVQRRRTVLIAPMKWLKPGAGYARADYLAALKDAERRGEL